MLLGIKTNPFRPGGLFAAHSAWREAGRNTIVITVGVYSMTATCHVPFRQLSVTLSAGIHRDAVRPLRERMGFGRQRSSANTGVLRYLHGHCMGPNHNAMTGE